MATLFPEDCGTIVYMDRHAFVVFGELGATYVTDAPPLDLDAYERESAVWSEVARYWDVEPAPRGLRSTRAR